MSERAVVEHDGQFWKTGGAGVLWLGLLLGPFAWMLDLGFSYPLVQWECVAQETWPLHLLSILSALVAVAGVLTAAWCYRSLPRSAELDGPTPFDRSRFMAVAGVMLSIGFFLVVVANAVPRFLLGPCQQ